jgi:hypothetical protein
MYRGIGPENQEGRWFPETVTAMALKSVKEDLQASTLRAISGLLGKLDYLASLRQENGSYSHWGLSRVHGEAAAQEALSHAHQSVVSKILRAPLCRLLDDVQDSCRSKNLPQVAFLGELEEKEDQALPANATAGSRRHLSSVLHALLALARSPQ